MLLGVNIDHVATLREARKINEPDPLEAALLCKRAGADQVTIHLREDRRHIHDFDARRIVESSFLPVNLECSIDPEMIGIMCHLKPHRVTLVPEKREEVTTEGGLDLFGQHAKITEAIRRLEDAEIDVSLFIDPTRKNIEHSKNVGASMVELHTGSYANLHLMLHTNLSRTPHSIPSLQSFRSELFRELEDAVGALRQAALTGEELGMKVAAGHGLNYQNVGPIAAIPQIIELNIGHSIVARSLFVGLEAAIKEMKALL